MDRLAEIQARLDAAWRGHDWAVVGDSVAEVYYPDVLQPIAENVHPVDATFIANAPTDIAYLLERVRALELIAVKARGLVRTAHPEDVGKHEVVRQWWDSLVAALTEGESNE